MEKDSKRTVRVTLLGKKYLIKTDTDEKAALQIAHYVNEKINGVKENTNTVTALDILMLTALNIAEDYFRAKNEGEAMLLDLEERSENLIKAIEAQIV